MMKKINVKLLVFTSVLTLVPMLIGVILFKELPATLPSHFGLDGQADGFSSKGEVVFLFPLLMLLIHIFTIVVTTLDPKARNVHTKMKQLVYWIIPMINGLVQLSIYGVAFGFISNTTRIGLGIMGSVFLIVGNYLPKTKQNYTIGLRLPWTLHNEENWNKTHRLAGKLWVIGGIVIIFNSFFAGPIVYISLGVLFIMTLVPVVYSYWISRLE